ncbi:MAG: proline--tRNA ligase [Flavobacterium sp.]|nr:proline--tRNA ligase [Flavobacterium sp.]
MRYSNAYIRTIKEDPQDAETVSHKLMIRASMVKKVSTGIYAYLPLGLKVLSRVMQIIRKELNAIGCSELLLPALLPSDPWKKTGRWDLYGKEMFKLSDRTDREFCLGPTHEEIITEIVKNDIKSYRDLPLFVYQIQTKFRDEPRPRFGVIRSKEFIMKDLYSFHSDEASLLEGYKKVFEAYKRIFSLMHLDFLPIEADNGTIGGAFSHEFVSTSKVGETAFAYCKDCGYSASLEAATSVSIKNTQQQNVGTLESVLTPECKTIDQVSAFLKIPPDRILKSLLYTNEDGKKYLVVVRGSDSIVDAKLKKLLGDEVALDEKTNNKIGFLGPVNSEFETIIADFEAVNIINATSGACEINQHLLNVNYERDWKATLIGDIRSVNDNDLCPKCQGKLKTDIGMEIGHTFALHDRYTKVLDASYVGSNGSIQLILMGCYGIGISRILAAVIEQYHDDKGIIWPIQLAPYQIEIIPVNLHDENQMKAANNLYEKLIDLGIETILDDRDISVGNKFKDSDLIGFPIRVVCGKTILDHALEVKVRRCGITNVINEDEIIPFLQNLIIQLQQKQ